MRLRFTVLASALVTLACLATMSTAVAAPQHNRGLTIAATPNPIIAGDGVLIYGHLNGPNNSDRIVRLYHRIDPRPFFTLISVTHTDAFGFYEFTRAEGIVMSNRSWFVRGPLDSHSRTIHEFVAADVSLASSAPGGLTRHPLIFSGHVTPNHAGNLVLLQQQKGSSDDWKTIGLGRVGPGSNFQIAHAWRVPGAYTVRALLPRDRFNIASPSDTVPVVIQQNEVPDFTIFTSEPIVTNGTSYTISGMLDQTGTTTPAASVPVTLYDRMPASGPFEPVKTAMTGPDGSYSFPNLVSSTNELYQVRTASTPPRHTAVLFEGVQDVVTMTAGSATPEVGQTITFSGNVSPDKVGHVIYLQRLGADGDWHTVEVRFVGATSTFQFPWTFGTPGTKEFRAKITGGPANVGGASSPVTVDVTLPPVASLPPAS